MTDLVARLIEFDFIRRICERWPDQGWAAVLSPGRLDKARALQQERNHLAHSQAIVEHHWQPLAPPR